MDRPIFIINAKNYNEGSGDRLARFIEYAVSASQDFKVNVLVAPPIVDLYYYARQHPEVLISQAVDTVGYGSSTGHIPLMRLIDMGLEYSLINHSENRVDHMLIKDINLAAEEHGFKLIVCIQSINELEELISLGVKPYAYAFEPPELIGTGRSVSKYAGESLRKAVDLCSGEGVRCLCGAGITDVEDVELSMEYGVDGILVASGVVKADNPLKKIVQFSHIMSDYYSK